MVSIPHTAPSVLLGFLAVISVTRADEPLFLLPDGERYEAVVPGTLDLAERARLSVHALTSFLSAEADYSPYGHAFFNRNPPYMSSIARGAPNWGKISQSLIMTRLMCGSRENPQVDDRMLRGMLQRVQLNPVAPTPVSRVMLALMDLYQANSSPELRAIIDRMAEEHILAAQHDERGAYYSDTPSDENASAIGVLGHWLPVFINGCAIRSMVRWYQLNGQPEHLELAGELVRFSLQPRYWQPEASPKAIVTPDRAQFRGHIHSYTQLLLGLLEYGAATGDVQLMQKARAGYEYLRNFGIPAIGLFGEACAVGDMTILAIRLSDLGIGDYWEDVDRYVRNHLTELQIVDPEKLTRLTDRMPEGRAEMDMNSGPIVPPDDSTDRTVARNVGAFLSDASHPSLIPPKALMYTICCTGNCTPALYWCWEAVVRPNGEGAIVHLLLNRASPLLDVDSYLPYQGKVVLRIKRARHVAVRLPVWVTPSDVQVSQGDQQHPFTWMGRYVRLDDLQPGGEICVTFLMAQYEETHTLKWKQGDFWQESNDPGPQWTADEPPAHYRFSFRGNTVVAVQPRDEGLGFPLYDRDALLKDEAPMHRVQRFIAPRLPAP